MDQRHQAVKGSPEELLITRLALLDRLLLQLAQLRRVLVSDLVLLLGRDANDHRENPARSGRQPPTTRPAPAGEPPAVGCPRERRRPTRPQRRTQRPAPPSSSQARSRPRWR